MTVRTTAAFADPLDVQMETLGEDPPESVAHPPTSVGDSLVFLGVAAIWLGSTIVGAIALGSVAAGIGIGLTVAGALIFAVGAVASRAGR